MFVFVFLAIASVPSVRSQEGEVALPDNNRAECVRQMVQWCDSMNYPQQGSGMSVFSLAYGDATGFYRVTCSSDSDGTNCNRNGSPWFSCAPDHTLTYNGSVLTEASTDVDEDICKTAHKAFNDIFVQNMNYNTSAMQKGLELFFEEMEAMREQMADLQRRLSNGPFMGSDFLKGFDLPLEGDDSIDQDESGSTEGTNLIEKE